MKPKIFIFVIMCLFFLSFIYSQAQENSSFNFRETKWGMTKEDVIKIEGKPTHQEKAMGLELVAYSKEIDGKECLIAFIFAENKLTRGKYQFLHDHVNKNLFINDYREIKDNLAEKYGKEKESKTQWLNSLYENEPDDWGRAVGYGHLRFFTIWQVPDTEITLALQGDNRKISLIVEYASTELKELESAAKKKAKKKIW